MPSRVEAALEIAASLVPVFALAVGANAARALVARQDGRRERHSREGTAIRERRIHACGPRLTVEADLRDGRWIITDGGGRAWRFDTLPGLAADLAPVWALEHPGTTGGLLAPHDTTRAAQQPDSVHFEFQEHPDGGYVVTNDRGIGPAYGATMSCAFDRAIADAAMRLRERSAGG